VLGHVDYVALGMAMLLTGVSACENNADGSFGRPYTVEMVREAFKQETGDELIVEDEARDVPIIGDATLLGVRPELDAKYGDFGIVVFRRLGSRKRAELDRGKRVDSTGTYWEHHPPENEREVPYWSAQRWYGNVGLTWYSKTREANEQWGTLNRALRRLTSKG
jgi:hypothetical protein